MNTIKNQFTFILISTLYLLSPLLQAQTDHPERHSQVIQSGEIPQGLTDSEWRSIQQQVGLAKYKPYPDKQGGYRSANLAHGWKIHYAADGTTTLTPHNAVTKPYYLGLKLSAIGYQNLQTLDKPQKISHKDFSVSYQWNENLQERWINSDQQLEQWFVLEHPPGSNDRQQPLTLQMILQSELKPKLTGNTLYFSGTNGTRITYNKLKVWDYNGKEIPAHMQLAGNTLKLLVDDQQAQYPLTIDPSFQQQVYLQASLPNFRDLFGWSVAISGDTMVVGAWGEDSNSTGVNGDESFGFNSKEDSGAAYIFIRTDSNWNQQAYLKASNTDTTHRFGWSVAISGDTVVVGARGEDSNSTGVNSDPSHDFNSAEESGAAYVFTRKGMTWSQQAYLKASNTDKYDSFGWSVAISGDTVVIGARGERSNSTGVNGNQSDNSATDSGAVYVFTRTGSEWNQQAYLKASNAGNGGYEELFGYSVAISGNTVVVGAKEEGSDSTGVNSDQGNNLKKQYGAAYIFTRTGTSWSQQAYLKASNTDEYDRFGASVAIFGDTVVVGARGESSNSTGVNGDQGDNSLHASGAAYVFTRTGTSWSQQAYLKASNTDEVDRFGSSVAISGDTVVVGAWGESSNSTGVNGDQSNNSKEASGATYVFTRIGTTWNQQAYLKAFNSNTKSQFGASVAISGDTVMVGASQTESQSGAAYVFTAGSSHPPIITPEYSGSWYDPSHNGEGYAIEILSNKLAQITWYTYDKNGHQVWIVGVGNIAGNTITVTDASITRGGVFGSGFNPADVVRQRWGTLLFTFNDCNHASINYDGPAEFGSGTLSLEHLSSISGLSCNQKDNPVNVSTALAKITGSWYNPSHDGEGYVIEVLDNNRATVYWYTYDQMGQQAWITGTGRVQGHRIILDQAISTQGGIFGRGFNPASVQRNDWGRISFDFSSCNTGVVNYESTAGFGNGQLNLVRLTSIDGVTCSTLP